MKYRREFEIAYVGLKTGEHNYSFEIGKEFFDLVEADSSEFEDIHINVDVKFVKHQNFFELTFSVNGRI
jgi:outer membrane protease